MTHFLARAVILISADDGWFTLRIICLCQSEIFLQNVYILYFAFVG